MNKQPRIADFRNRITFQINTQVVNARGGKDTKWVDDFDVWANIEEIGHRGMNYGTGDKLNQKASHYIIIRSISSIPTAHRIKHHNDYYKIISTTRANFENKQYLKFAVNWEQDIR